MSDSSGNTPSVCEHGSMMCPICEGFYDDGNDAVERPDGLDDLLSFVGDHAEWTEAELALVAARTCSCGCHNGTAWHVAACSCERPGLLDSGRSTEGGR